MLYTHECFRVDQKDNHIYPIDAANAAGICTSHPNVLGRIEAKERLLRLPEVKHMVGLGTTAIYQKIKDGDFPSQIKLGRLSGWVYSEIQAWIDQQIKVSRSVVTRAEPG